jgi:hypothetical protein
LNEGELQQRLPPGEHQFNFGTACAKGHVQGRSQRIPSHPSVVIKILEAVAAGQITSSSKDNVQGSDIFNPRCGWLFDLGQRFLCTAICCRLSQCTRRGRSSVSIGY